MIRTESTKGFWKGPAPKLLPVVFLSLLLTSCATIKHLLYTYDPLNFHAVKDGVMYRSGQPTGRDLRMVVNEHGIKSVINLRGAQPGEDWYDEEVAVSQELGLKRVDISMSAARLPHRGDLLRLLDAFKDLPPPILVHCKAGADRTGEAAAVFALDHLKWSNRKAAGQLHPYYGHVPDLYPAKTYFIREVYRGEEWAREFYDPCKQDYKYYDKGTYCGIALKPFSLRVDDER
jgi:protein tyrosine/serine phosphatase